MDTLYTTLITVEALRDRLNHPDWIVFDVRHDLADVQAGLRAYSAGHIPGAHFLHLDGDLSGPRNGFNGRHPLPDRAAFAQRLATLGVSAGSQVIVYDEQSGMFASRLWWMLRWIGHAQVAVLDGGWKAWIDSAGAIATGSTAPRPAGDLILGEAAAEVVGATDVLANLGSARRLVVDARAADRFRGENETLDPVGGHIPGACNRPFRDNLAPDGRFKSASQLRAEWLGLLDGWQPSQVIAQCGSGVTACHNLLAMEIAGLPGAALYAGSWSEWCADPARPVER